MEKKTKLLKILKKLSPDDAASVTLDTAISEIEKFGRILNLAPLLEAIDGIKAHYSSKTKELSAHVASQVAELKTIVEKERKTFSEGNDLKVGEIKREIQSIRESIKGLASVDSLSSLETKLSTINELGAKLDSLNNSFVQYKTSKDKEPKVDNIDVKTHKEDIKNVQELIERVRVELINKIGSLGGGSANQQINVNSSVMSTKYADINFVSDTAIRWTATDDNSNKRVNIRASMISGGSGGGGGTWGSITGVITNQTDLVTSILALVPYTGATSDVNLGVNQLILGAEGTSGQISAPNAVSANTAGPGIDIGAGGGTGTADGGGFSMSAGYGGDTGNGGSFAMSAGSGGATSGNGGGLSLEAGSGTAGNSNGGNITFTPGTASGSGTPGRIIFASPTKYNGATSQTVTIQAASTAGNWTLTLPTDDGSNNQVLTTDGNGITRWASVAATGGSGITRTSSIITHNTLGDDTASIDRVYIANDGLCFTLPDAANNLNRYTVKNVTASVLVTAVGGDTIDGSGSVLMALPNLAHDFISDNSNWHII